LTCARHIPIEKGSSDEQAQLYVYGTLFFVVAAAGQAHAQSAGNNDIEIAALKQQLRLMEQSLIVFSASSRV
jgi:hypothetical protein